MKYLLSLSFFLLPFFSTAQNEPCALQVSLLTCSPGEELYATFGHTAVRVKDSTQGIDIVYNYGTFDFDDPQFYTKFVRGKLDYFLSADPFPNFMYQYEYDKRSVYEQVLNLGCAEKAKVVNALQVNAQEANKWYRYDFLRDNCTTRAKDIIAKNLRSAPQLADVRGGETPTFRNLLYIYLDNGGQHWSKFGIDLLLGSPLDKKVTAEEALFLPDNLLRSFDNATLQNQRLVNPAVAILKMPSPVRGSAFFTPMVVFSLLLVVIAILSFIPRRGIQRMIAVFDFIFFLVLGLAGCLLLFMWFGTEHAVCKDNMNLLWALPTHLIAAFALHSQKRWLHYYLMGVIVLASLLLIGWIFLPQQLNLAAAPLILLVLLRSWLIILKPHASIEKRK